MINKLVAINSLNVPKIKKILLYAMKFLVPNYSCLQNPWLGWLPPPDLCSLCPQLNLLNPPPKQNSWVRHWSVVNISDIMSEMWIVSTFVTASFQEFEQCGWEFGIGISYTYLQSLCVYNFNWTLPGVSTVLLICTPINWCTLPSDFIPCSCLIFAGCWSLDQRMFMVSQDELNFIITLKAK